ncbi:Uma2 family endonuclease [Zavarzinella formosa]|uniref:Uma2 family endonuclease n=1 Tax=Zavarzinella formosa TaxID=360055 RepID=UPI000317B22A|nr:Uma2 family endonuclease [Zavarzinella formosa]
MRFTIHLEPSEVGFDTNEKRLLYARSGIAEYWVLDINGRQLLVYRHPLAGDYDSSQTFGPADTVSPLAAPTSLVRVADLLM